MAKKIYIGEILEQVNTAIAALQTDMATMSGDMANVVAELINVKDVAAMSANFVNVAPGSDKEVILNTADKSATSTSPTDVISFKALCQGAILLTAEIKSSHSSLPCQVGYRVNGGANASILGLSTSSSSYEVKSGVVLVSAGDTITLTMYAVSTAGVTMSMKAGAKVGYEFVDIINDGAIFPE